MRHQLVSVDSLPGMSTTEQEHETQTFHGGRLVARRLKAHGVTKLFTLSGGHLFSIYDGCREEGIDIVDVRHESAAAFAAEGWAKVTREPGVAALTAGPGVTNGMSAMASALQNHSPMVVLGGRAPAMRWGQGSLQEIDHVPFVRPVTQARGDAGLDRRDPGPGRRGASRRRCGPHGGPAFVDFPLDHVFIGGPGRHGEAPARARRGRGRRAAELDRAVALLRDAERPVIMAGTNLYWGARRGRAARARRGAAASRSSSTAWRAAACPPTTSCSSRARARRG